jgi:hypothetical protein
MTAQSSIPDRPHAPGSRPWKRVSVGMFLGSACDASVGAAMLIAPAWTLATMHLTPAAPETYVRLNGVFLLVLALYYAMTGMRPRAYVGNVVLAIVGRAAGCAFYFVGAVAFAEPVMFYGLGMLNLGLAALHAFTLVHAVRVDGAFFY